MTYSMTGYGYAEFSDERYSMSLELKSYNNRYLDIHLTIPPSLGAFEQDLRTRIKESCARGRVEMHLGLQNAAEKPRVEVDEQQAMALVQAVGSLKKKLKLPGTLSLDQLISFEGIIRFEKRRNPEETRPIVLELLDQALGVFVESRRVEGERTAEDIFKQMGRFRSSLDTVKKRSDDIESHMHRQIRERFLDVLGTRVDEDRILAELASLLVKYSINEEMSRLDVHIAQFQKGFDGPGPVGKRLDFLCQEMNQETNTIGSKTIFHDVSLAVVEMKDALENIREQLRNIE